MTKSKSPTGPELHCELAGGISKHLSGAITKVMGFITTRGNLYKPQP